MELHSVVGAAQVVLDSGIDVMKEHKPKPHPAPILVAHTLLLLPLIALLSLLWLIASFFIPRLYRYFARRQAIFLDDEVVPEDEAGPEPYYPTQGLWADFNTHIGRLRSSGTIIVILDVLRFLCLGTLLGLSILAAIQAEAPKHEHKGHFQVSRKKHKKKKNKSVIDDYSSLEWGEFGACIFYLYNILFSLTIMALRNGKLRRSLTRHVDLLLLLGFSIYAYRDIWPKATYYLSVSDPDNWVTWTRIGILAVASMLIPMLRPRTYVPVDPLNPTPEKDIHPEQTACPLSFVFFEFMTGLVFKAWKTNALPYEELHPLADYDRAELLYNKHMGRLDPLRRRAAGLKPLHLFWGLLRTFRFQFTMASLMAAIAAVAEILPAYAIKNILTYLQDRGIEQRIRPIVWVAALFIGQLGYTMAFQYYIFVMTRGLVRAEAIMTQLLFDQALRLRMKDSLGEEDEKEESTKAIENMPIIEVEDTDGDSSAAPTAVDSSTEPSKQVKVAPPPAPKSQGLAGKINVLMAQDIEAVVEGRDIPLVAVYLPVEICLCLYLLFQILSWSALFGVGAMVLTLPLPGMLTQLSATVQTKKMEATDVRVDSVTEAIGAWRIVKMFGWEARIKQRISQKREEELKLTWRRRILSLAIELVNIFLPVMVMAASFAAYTLIEKKHLTSATVFTSMTVFEILKGHMMMGFYMVNQFVTSGVSLQRLNKFVNESDMIDAFQEDEHPRAKTSEQLAAEKNGLIRLKNATFAWGKDTGNKNIYNFRLRVPDVTFSKGKINLICGPTGSGKSSFLAALIGELHFEPQGSDSFFHLPREGGVSYAAQESWCMSSSIKENILFGTAWDEARYKKVIHDCALETDLTLFDDGDDTEIGEKGITLSGGQKARVTLARAIYSHTSVVLLDDIFSALDTLTSRFILDNLFSGDLVKDRTILLVTHHTHLAGPVADFMVTLGEDGTVSKAAKIDDSMISAAPSEVDLAAKVEQDNEKEEAKSGPTQPPKPDQDAAKKASKLIKDEEKSEGRISRKALISFFSTFGGPAFWITYFGLLFTGQGLTMFQSWWLGQWSKAYELTDDPNTVSVGYWLGLYMAWVVISIVAVGMSATIYFYGCMKASRTIHAKLVDRCFGAYMRFMDTTPVGRIISRFTKDMKAIDGPFTDVAVGVFEISVSLFIKFVSIIAFVPLFGIPALAIGAIGGFIGELYIHAQLSVKREMSNAKSPLFSHLAAAVSGIVSIRAYGAQERIKVETRAKADKYTRAATAFYNLNRWVTIRIDMLGGLFSAALGAFLIYGANLDAATSGFALSQAVSFAGMILWWVRMLNEMEVMGNSVERIEDYLVIPQEPAYDKAKAPPASWPSSGEIVFEHLSAKYSNDGPVVLDDLNITIKSGEKVGIVGRTGSGKSTLALALLKMVPTTGSVVIDGQNTNKINLHELRTHVTIIPQDPILLSGTLRFNLDPFDEHNDAELSDALEQAGLGADRRLPSSSTPATPVSTRLTLDTQISAGGSNLSQGQRQLVALARALVRGSKVLILDEATASVDFETDSLIQKSIRNLPGNTTVLTVAHRLATVMDYDKILVLGAGKVLEFDTPDALKSRKDSYFAKLVQAMDG